jgi:hypothetical protein
MADCKKILILRDDVPKAAIILFDSKKQILWTAIRLLYMLISRSNRIGDEMHIIHMDTAKGIGNENDDLE